jgi:hypothetical protein
MLQHLPESMLHSYEACDPGLTSPHARLASAGFGLQGYDVVSLLLLLLGVLRRLPSQIAAGVKKMHVAPPAECSTRLLAASGAYAVWLDCSGSLKHSRNRLSICGQVLHGWQV